MPREYFCASHDMLLKLKSLSDSEFGRLMRATLQYSCNGQTPPPSYLKGKEASHFDGMMVEVDKQVRAYEAKCRQNSENQRRRWQKQRAEDKEQSVRESYDRIQSYTNVTNNKYKNNTPLTPQGVEVAAAMYDPGVAQVAECWQQNMGVLSPALGEQIAAWVQVAEPGMVCAVIRYAVLAGKRDGRYIDSVIRNAVARNVTTLAAWNAEQVERQQQNTPNDTKTTTEVKRKWLR